MDEDYYLKPYKNILDSCVEFLKGHCNSSCTIDHVDFHRYFIFLFKYKARDNTNNIKLTQIIKKPIFQLQLAAVPPKFIHMIHSFFLQILATFLLSNFADLVSISSNSIKFCIFGNKAEGKHPRVLKITCSSLYDFFSIWFNKIIKPIMKGSWKVFYKIIYAY